MGYAYMASPYNDLDEKIRHERYKLALAAVAHFSKAGFTVYSPIVHYHNAATQFEMPTDVDFWWVIDSTMIIKSSALWVLCIDGWDKSKGVAREIEYARELKLPILRIEGEDWLP